jgi:DNA-binding NarL/FixJ family response regulator
VGENLLKQTGRADKPVEPPAQPPVLVVDGDRESCTSIANALLRAGYGVRAAAGEDAVALARKQRPLAVILEAVLPGATGYEICHELREEHGESLPIVFVSGERSAPPDRVVGLLVGADDYIAKPLDPDELIARLRRLIARSDASTRNGRRSEAFAELTSRESEVLRLLALGLNQGDIARHLHISPATVGTHIQRVLSKLDVHSRTQAVALAYRERLVDRN